MNCQHITVRGFAISVDTINVRSTNGTEHSYLRARLPLGKDPLTHRSKPAKVITAKTEEELQEKILRCLDVRTMLNGYAESKITVQNWCEYYLGHYLQGALNTQRSIELICKNHIIPSLGNIYLQELTEVQVEDFRDYLLREKHLAPSTVGAIISTLNMIMDRAVHNRAVLVNPVSMVRKPRKQYKQKVILSKEQAAAFMEEIKHDRYGNLMGLLLTTGFRVGEGLGLAYDRVDSANHSITVNQHVITVGIHNKTQTILEASTKTGVNRTITVPRQAIDYIQAEKDEQKTRSVSLGTAWSNPYNLIFTNNYGTVLQYKTIERHIKRIGERIERPDLTPHVLRHTAATILYLRSHNIIWVRDMLGHQNLVSTEHYIHVTTEDLQTIPYYHSQEMAKVKDATIPFDLDYASLQF